MEQIQLTLPKRMFDLVFGIFSLALLLPLMVLIAVFCLLLEGRPIFYFSERMFSPTQGFTLIKFRTMRFSSENFGVTGADKTDRISKFQGFLRKTRLDELPQLFNILAGHMSFVGPRPPLRIYVQDYPEIYESVLRSRPGVTGLATLRIHRYEANALAKCITAEETDHVYRKRCIPKKAAVDLMYQCHTSICFDMKIIWKTIARFG